MVITCKLTGCDRECRTAGFCNAHYLRSLRGKDLSVPVIVSERHGMTGSKTHRAWINMRSRCNNPNNPRYADWGGRGIKVCERWGLFSNFYKDMGDRPEGASLERIDNNLGYSPDNCRWATPLEQAQNRRMYNRNTSGYTGVYWQKNRNKFVARIMYNHEAIQIGSFNTKEDAVKARLQAEKDIYKDVQN